MRSLKKLVIKDLKAGDILVLTHIEITSEDQISGFSQHCALWVDDPRPIVHSVDETPTYACNGILQQHARYLNNKKIVVIRSLLPNLGQQVAAYAINWAVKSDPHLDSYKSQFKQEILEKK
ncbi:hypothetical protein DC094_13640 [Pelagibaculum spongiae]|uniref:Uncharacterized protein n=1 Tax=Pelagibaculum spongiae TaxID=2080658 RepID=A0A2V1GZX9_9GAMM|nr:hypothetical protein DC094_13640 [Pelagibaculum spongiae]